MMLHNSQTGLVVNSVARKKKTERLVPPLIPNHSALVNGNSIGPNNGGPGGGNVTPNNGGFMNSTS